MPVSSCMCRVCIVYISCTYAVFRFLLTVRSASIASGRIYGACCLIVAFGMIEVFFLDLNSGVIFMFTLGHSTLRAGRVFRPIFQARIVSTSSQTPQTSLKKGLYATVFAVSAGLFAVYYFDSRSAIHRYIITPTLRYALDPEASHRLAVRVLGSGFGPRDTQADDERLRSEVFATPTASEAWFNVVGSALGNTNI